MSCPLFERVKHETGFVASFSFHRLKIVLKIQKIKVSSAQILLSNSIDQVFKCVSQITNGEYDLAAALKNFQSKDFGFGFALIFELTLQGQHR